jgi:hypothetical protein
MFRIACSLLACRVMLDPSPPTWDDAWYLTNRWRVARIYQHR